MTASASGPGGKKPVQEVEILSSWAILIVVTLLLMVFLTSYGLQRFRVRIIHESVVAVLLGILAGLSIRLEASTDLQKMVAFDHSYFFNLLLPPIILNSGYDLKVKHFFRNLGSILTFAFLGTIVSTLVIGVLVYGLVFVGLHSLKLSFTECLMFGSILSSTDPVTVLSIFNQVKVDPRLYAIIFGESMLNDAVALVLYSTLNEFQKSGNGSFISALGSFTGVFCGSFAIGLVIALLTALLLKHTDLHRYPAIESCIVFLLAYSSYVFSTAISLSGIVSLLFCAITMKHYMYPNLSLQSQRTTRYMFHVMAHLAENIIFIYLGMTIFTQQDEVFRWALVLFVFLFILVGRAASVFPLAWLINFFTEAKSMGLRERVGMGFKWPSAPWIVDVSVSQDTDTISKPHQVMLWWAGLRGAIAFALSMDIQTPSANEIRTTTLVVVVLSILIFGGTTLTALQRLRIRTGVDEELEGELEDDDGEHGDGQRTRERRESDVHPLVTPPAENRHWFISFDNQYLVPLFTRATWRQPARRDGFGAQPLESIHPRQDPDNYLNYTSAPARTTLQFGSASTFAIPIPSTSAGKPSSSKPAPPPSQPPPSELSPMRRRPLQPFPVPGFSGGAATPEASITPILPGPPESTRTVTAVLAPAASSAQLMVDPEDSEQ